MKLKDFTLLDSEKIRSYLAQLDGKVSDTKTQTSEHSAGTKAKAKSGQLAKLVVEAGAEGSYLYKRSSSETSSIHHAAFDIFVENLKKRQLLSNSLHDDKPFAEIVCNVKVADYKLLAQQFNGVASLMPLMNRLTQQQGSGQKHNNASDKHQVNQIKDIASAIELLFGDVRILQLVNDEGTVVAQASLDEELIPEQSLFFARNNEVLPDKYTVFCLKQLTNTPPPVVKESQTEFGTAVMNAVSSLTIMRETFLPVSDAQTIVPIAIYRNISDI